MKREILEQSLFVVCHSCLFLDQSCLVGWINEVSWRYALFLKSFQINMVSYGNMIWRSFENLFMIWFFFFLFLWLSYFCWFGALSFLTFIGRLYWRLMLLGLSILSLRCSWLLIRNFRSWLWRLLIKLKKIWIMTLSQRLVVEILNVWIETLKLRQLTGKRPWVDAFIIDKAI